MKKDDIAENVLKRGKEGVKQNIIEALDEFFDEYADEMWMVVEEVIKLRAENVALRERLDKAVEVPDYVFGCINGKVERIFTEYLTVGELKNLEANGYSLTKEAAEACLSELKGEKGCAKT